MHPSHASCTGGICTCNAPLYTSNGLHCICGAGSELNYIGLCSADFGTKCLLNYTCQDIDECSNGAHDCPSQQLCVNFPGSFHCIDPAVASTSANSVTKSSACNPQCLSQAECVRRGSHPPRCECSFGYHGDGINCTWTGQFTSPPNTEPEKEKSNSSNLILILAIVGGIAGSLALLYVLAHMIRKCRQPSK